MELPVVILVFLSLPEFQPDYCTRCGFTAAFSFGSKLIRTMLRFRLVFDRLRDFPRSEIYTVIPLTPIIPQPIKSLTDLTHQLMQYSG
jgi:hypothetical protein